MLYYTILVYTILCYTRVGGTSRTEEGSPGVSPGAGRTRASSELNYIYIYICTCMYICIHTYIHIYTYIRTHNTNNNNNNKTNTNTNNDRTLCPQCISEIVVCYPIAIVLSTAFLSTTFVCEIPVPEPLYSNRIGPGRLWDHCVQIYIYIYIYFHIFL